MALINAFTLIFSLILGVQSTAKLPATASLPPTAVEISNDTESNLPTINESAARSDEQVESVEKLAKCLTKKGVIMYGAYWCPHCQTQKSRFGEAFQYVKYQECDAKGENGSPSICKAADIQAYPTWEIPGHPRMEGEQTLEDLAKASSCPL